MLNLQGESIPIIESYSSKVKEKLLFNNVQESIISSANYKLLSVLLALVFLS